MPIDPLHITQTNQVTSIWVDGENGDADFTCLFYVHRGVEKLAEKLHGPQRSDLSSLPGRIDAGSAYGAATAAPPTSVKRDEIIQGAQNVRGCHADLLGRTPPLASQARLACLLQLRLRLYGVAEISMKSEAGSLPVRKLRLSARPSRSAEEFDKICASCGNEMRRESAGAGGWLLNTPGMEQRLLSALSSGRKSPAFGNVGPCP